MVAAVFRAGKPVVAPMLDASQAAVLALPFATSAAVFGAPGSGKTATAIELVADRILRGGFPPDSVLVLAPRRTQAGRLRDALARRVGVALTGPLARTPSSLAFQIARASAAIEGRDAPVLLAGGEQDALIKQLLEGSTVPWPERLGPDVRALTAFRTELRELWARAAERGLDAGELRALGLRSGRPEWVAAAAFEREYLDVLMAQQDHRFAPAELVRLAAAAIWRGTGGQAAEALRLVVVDDLQDATESTVLLLRALASTGVTIVGFGDPDVAADAFRGGEPDVLGRFASRLGIADPARLVLSTVHRSAPELRGVVTAVTERIGTALAGEQRQARAAGHPVDGVPPLRRITATTAAEQADRIAWLLRDAHLGRGIGWTDMAVVVRSGALAEPLARALALGGVPTRTSTTGAPLAQDPAARALLDVLAVALDLGEVTAESAAQLLSGPFGGLDRLELRRLRLALRATELAAGGTRGAGELLVAALADPAAVADLDTAFGRRAHRLAESIALARDRAVAGDSVEELLWLLWERSGLAPRWRAAALGAGVAAADANRNLDGVVALFTAAAREVERDPALVPATFVTELLGAEVPDDSLTPRPAQDTVLVTTPVGVAGLEFDTVVLAGVQEGVWPNLRPRGSLLGAVDLPAALLDAAPDRADVRRMTLSDELRLFALAASRATSTLVVSAVENEDERASVLMGLVQARGAVPVEIGRPKSLRPLVGTLRRTAVAGRSASDRAAAAAALARLAAADVPGAHPSGWDGVAPPTTTAPLVPDPETPVPVSPSALSTFEESPLDWFLQRVAGGESTVSSAVGTMLHWVMETAQTPDEAAMLAALEGRWGELDFEADWIDAREHRLAQRMTKAIAAYLADRARSGAALVAGEQSFEYRVGRALVRGTIDRVERDADGRLRIVDLKTGKGRVAKKDAPTDPQLGLYQLAVRQGAVEGAAADDATSGAALLYVRAGARATSPFDLVAQAALTDEDAAAFAERAAGAADGMAAAAFEGSVAPSTKYGSARLRDRLARVPEVCGDGSVG